MGYYIQTEQVEIFINRSFFTPACRLLEAQGFTEDHPAMTGGMYTAGSAEPTKKWWAWVNMDLLRQAIVNNDLPEVLRIFRFTVEQDGDGNIVSLDFDCKQGNEEDLFRVIARYCTGRIVWRGEENEEWVWDFRDGDLRVLERVVYRTTLDPEHAEQYDEIKGRLKAASYTALVEGLATLIVNFGVKFNIVDEDEHNDEEILFSVDGKPIN